MELHGYWLLPVRSRQPIQQSSSKFIRSSSPILVSPPLPMLLFAPAASARTLARSAGIEMLVHVNTQCESAWVVSDTLQGHRRARLYPTRVCGHAGDADRKINRPHVLSKSFGGELEGFRLHTQIFSVGNADVRYWNLDYCQSIVFFLFCFEHCGAELSNIRDQ